MEFIGATLTATLRAEITISVPKHFRILRRTDDPNWKPEMRIMRQSLTDMQQRAGVSQTCLDRYCSALATVDDSTTLSELTATVERRAQRGRRSVLGRAA